MIGWPYNNGGNPHVRCASNEAYKHMKGSSVPEMCETGKERETAKFRDLERQQT